MDVNFAWNEPGLLFLAGGAAALGIGAALIHTYRALQNGGSLKRAAIVSAATACFAAAPILIMRGWGV
jgi:hypothetical protein